MDRGLAVRIVAIAACWVVAGAASCEPGAGGGVTPTTTTSTTTPSAGCPDFPATNAWNTDVSASPVHTRSAAWVASIGSSTKLHPDFGTFWDDAPIGIPFVHVGAGQAKVPVSFEYASQSDPGPYPIPRNAPIEGGPASDGDRHVIVIDDAACKLYELFAAYPQGGGTSWEAGSGAVFNLKSNALRPDYWTSADAAGLPIYPGLVRYDEVVGEGLIDHALRFTISRTQRGFIHPATHYASVDHRRERSAHGGQVPDEAGLLVRRVQRRGEGDLCGAQALRDDRRRQRQQLVRQRPARSPVG